MKSERNQLVLRLLLITSLLFSEGLGLPGTSYAQKSAKTAQQTRKRRKVIYATVGQISTREEADEIRATLIAGTGNDHDEPMKLAMYGDIESVPAMLAVLKRNPANPDGSVVCTRAHCLYALRKLTKADAGNKTEDWEKWWDNYQKERVKK